MTVALSTLQWRGKLPREFSSSTDVTRSFCADCGTPLTYRHASYGDRIDVAIATLDNAARFAPADHIWMDDALDWDRPGDGLPQHSRTRP